MRPDATIALISVVCFLNVAAVATFDALRGPCNDSCPMSRTGDIILGGLFPVHNMAKEDCTKDGMELDGKTCHQNRRTVRAFGFERLEAMRFAVERINSNDSLLPGITLGYELRDTCSNADYALRQSLNFIINNNDDKVTASVGVVGAASSGISERVTDLLSLFFVPLISYASSSALLSDFQRYQYFFRTIPSDEFQATAMVDIAVKYGWNYVHGIHSTGTYGESGFDSFSEGAKKEGIDVGLRIALRKEASYKDVENALAPLKLNSSSTSEFQNGSVIVMFSDLTLAKTVLEVVEKTKELSDRGFTFIGSDSWGDKDVILPLNAANGLLAVIPSAFKVPDYENHVASLHPSNHTGNKWLVNYWDCKLNCSFENSSCSSSAKLPIDNLDSKVGLVIDAVNAFAHALHNYLLTYCRSDNGSCFKQELKDQCTKDIEECGKKIKDQLLNVTFMSVSKQPFSFNSNGDFTNAEYDIKNLRNGTIKTIGTWQRDSEGKGVLNINDPVIWYSNTTKFPLSKCSPDCGEGVLRKTIAEYINCWKCEGMCAKHFFLYKSKDSLYGQCEKCPENQTSNDLGTECIALDVTYLRWDDGLAIFLIILASVGSILVIGTLSAFYVKRHTPLVMASSRELSVVMLLGILLCYILTFVFVAKPTNATCGIRRFFFGVLLSMIFGALFIKTNRISRLFNRRSASVQRPPFISPTSQLVFTGIIVLVACLISGVWLLLAPPDAYLDSQTSPNEEVTLTCRNVIDVGLLASWIYIFLLIVLCIVFAYKTRKSPENFKETLFINFAAYAEMIIWLAFIPVGIIDIHAKDRAAFMSLAMTLTASAAWGCLFVPKLYIILFRPERNVRQPTMRRQSRPSLGETAFDIGRKFGGGGGSAANLSSSTGGHTDGSSSDKNHTRYEVSKPNSSEALVNSS
eukprot:m.309622 g.309622  ORF g.309622 m.309622 type:complete len:917 (+) comp47122_c0_seq1:114-2864(+)